MGRKYLIRAAILAGLALTGSSAAVTPEVSPSAVNSADEQIVEDLVRQCASRPCRTLARHFSLNAADGKIVEGTTELFPYVSDKGVVFVYPGETISLSMARQDNQLAPPVFVAMTDTNGTTASKQAGPPPVNLSFELRQLDGKPGTFLAITNQIDAVVKFDLLMYVPIAGGMRAMRTSSCPVMPPQSGLKTFTGIEHWPHPVMLVAIANIRILPSGARSVCE